MKTLWSACLTVMLVGATAPAVQAQESNSAPLVKKLVAALDEARLDLIAAKDPSSGDYVCALYVAGSQLLVVSAKYQAPDVADAHILHQEYNEIYMDLNTASVPGTRIYVEDFAADGLKPQRVGTTPGDGFDSKSLKITFDSDWKKQGLTQDAYLQKFKDADGRYSLMLNTLIKALSDSSSKVAAR